MQAAHPLLGKRLLVITAHPDDESYVMAGTLAANTKAGGSTLLVCATRGEKGASHLRKPMTTPALAACRCRELRMAAAIVGVRRIIIDTIPDGQLQQRLRAFTRTVRAAARKFKPEVIMSFGPCGVTGHHDHIAAGKIAHAMAQRERLPFAAAVLSPRLQRQAKQFLKSRRYNPHYLHHIRFTSPTHTIPIQAPIKRRAIRCHASQMDGGRAFTGFPKYIVEGLLRREYFHIWQPR